MLNKTSKSLSARIFGPYLSFVKGTSSRLKKSNNSRDRTSCKMEAHKVSMKTLFKKILPSKKASENPVLRRKISKPTISKLGIKIHSM